MNPTGIITMASQSTNRSWLCSWLTLLLIKPGHKRYRRHRTHDHQHTLRTVSLDT